MSVFYLSVLETANNNSGVVLKAATTSNILNNVARPLLRDGTPFGSTVVVGVNAQSAVPLGNFAYNNERPLVKGFTTTLNGGGFASSANAIRSTGNAATNLTSGIHPISSVRTRLEKTAFREGRFNMFTGKYNVGYPDVQLDDLGVDIAAVPSRLNPGRLHYTYSKRIVSTGYESKTG
jgi:hypothetical protein